MISKRSRIEKIKYNNRYKIIYSTPYRQIYKYLNRLSPSYAKNFMYLLHMTSGLGVRHAFNSSKK